LNGALAWVSELKVKMQDLAYWLALHLEKVTNIAFVLQDVGNLSLDLAGGHFNNCMAYRLSVTNTGKHI
jgi:hypothetical protein